MLGLFGYYALCMTLKGVTYGGLFEMLCALLKEVQRPSEAAGLPMGAAQTIPFSCVIGMWMDPFKGFGWHKLSRWLSGHRTKNEGSG
jgi:hypothetical protein